MAALGLMRLSVVGIHLQVALAERLQLPLFVHCREAYPRLAAILRSADRAAPLLCRAAGCLGFAYGRTNAHRREAGKAAPNQGAAQRAASLPTQTPVLAGAGSTTAACPSWCTASPGAGKTWS